MTKFNLEKMKKFIGVLCIAFSVFARIITNGEKFILLFLLAGILLISLKKNLIGSIISTIVFALNLILYVLGNTDYGATKTVFNVIGIVLFIIIFSTCFIKKNT